MAKAAKPSDSVLIEVPVSQPDLNTYSSEHINVQLGCEKRANAVKMLFEQTMRQGARVRNRTGEGIVINNPGRVILWLLDRVVDECEQNGIVLSK